MTTPADGEDRKEPPSRCTHKDASVNYCQDCRCPLCGDCSAAHAGAHHRLQSLAELAAPVQPSEATLRLEAESLCARVQEVGERELNKLNKRIEAFATRAREKYAKAREDMLTEGRTLAESLANIEKMPSEQIAPLRSRLAGLKANLEEYCKGCKRTRGYLRAWDDTGRNERERLQGARDITAMRYEKEKEMRLLVQKIIEFKMERIALAAECDDLKNRIAKANKMMLNYNEEEAQLKKIKAEYETEVRASKQTVLDSQSELAKLETLIKEKQELLTRVNSDLDGYRRGSYAGPEEIKSKKTTKYSAIVTTDPIELARIHEEHSFMQSKFIHFYDVKLATLLIYHIESKTIFNVSGKDVELPTNYDSVQIGNKIILSGGFDPVNIEFLRTTQQIEVVKNSLIQRTARQNMKLPRSQHKLVALSSRIIYCMGGKNKKDRYMSSCERFDVESDTWSEAAPLNEAKFYIAAASFNCSHIYVFGGCGHKGALSTIEMLRVEENKWHVVKLAGGDKWAARDEGACFQSSSNEILVFGGIIGNDAGTDEVYTFNVEKNTLTRNKNRLQAREWFTMRSPVRLEDTMYIFGYYAKDIHTYSFGKRSWERINEEVWAKLANGARPEGEKK